jgi:hypothetical protein
VARKHSLDLEMSDRLARVLRVERLSERRHTVAANRRLDPPAPRPRPAAHQREILAFELALTYETLQSLMRLRRTRHDEESRGVTIEPVHDAGPVRISTRRAALQQAVNECAALVTGRRVDDYARRLVDDEEAVVLPGDP